MNMLETFNAEHFFGALKGKVIPLVINAFHALANGEMTVKHADVILYYYTLYLCISLLILSAVVTAALWLVAAGMLQLLSIVVFGLGWHVIVWKHACWWGLGTWRMLLLHAGFYYGVVRRVVKVALRRSGGR
jgi:hypothetical protein